MSDSKPADDPRRPADSWVTALHQSWHPGRLAECMRELPAPGAPQRRAALAELVKADLLRQWQAGRRVPVEDYLRDYPELAGDDRVLRKLVNAEIQARQEAGPPLKKDELARRFPHLAEEARRPSDLATPSAGSPALDTPAGGVGYPRPVELPERFGRYRIVRRLGRGGMGAVFLAEDTRLRRQVALKVPHLAPGADAQLRARFLREARAAAALHHPHICPVFDVGEHEGVLFLTMPLLKGQTLAERLASGPRIDQVCAAEVVRKVALAVAYAHGAGLVHRDLKPANVMLDEHGEPKVMDFGLARGYATTETRLTQSGAVVGTPAYMSPEQVKNEPVGPASDQFSVGVILYELLTGELPFQGAGTAVYLQIATEPPAPPRQLRPDLHPALEAICLRAMQKDPARRFASLKDMAAALKDWERPVDVFPVSGPVDVTVEAEPIELVPVPESSNVRPAPPLPPGGGRRTGRGGDRGEPQPVAPLPPGGLPLTGFRYRLPRLASGLLGAAACGLLLGGGYATDVTFEANLRPEGKFLTGLFCGGLLGLLGGLLVRSLRGWLAVVTLTCLLGVVFLNFGPPKPLLTALGLGTLLAWLVAVPAHLLLALVRRFSGPARSGQRAAGASWEWYLVVAAVLAVGLIAAFAAWRGARYGSPDRTNGGKQAAAPKLEPPSFPMTTEEARAYQQRSADALGIPVEVTHEGVNMKFVWLPPGTFRCGSPATEAGRQADETPYNVRIPKGFYMATTEVTDEQWAAVMQNLPYLGLGVPQGSVTADDCRTFCRKLGERIGKPVRLPTDFEWEYACRAGTATTFHGGHGEEGIKGVGWYAVNSENQAHPVGQLRPNAWGLYDMHGNFWEWCADSGDHLYDGFIDPQEAARDNQLVRVRGGAYTFPPENCRSAYRAWPGQAATYTNYGFRVCYCLE